ncbi:hypothetical protein ACKUB1_02455 [Methanospirillum stamsii]|nr:hypothetical protein [Methanospirillum stamsii]
MHVRNYEKTSKFVQYCMEVIAFTIHLAVPVVLMVIFLSLYHGMWIR